jgi:hypothetical protein
LRSYLTLDLAFSWSFAPAPYACITLPSIPAHPKLLPPELEPAIILHDCIYNSLYRIGHTCVTVRRRGSAIITSIMSELTGQYMLSLVREAIKTIEELPYTRLEAQVVAELSNFTSMFTNSIVVSLNSRVKCAFGLISR